MKKRFRRIELTKEGKMITAGAVAAIVLLALLAFFFLFRVDKVYVVGNTRYTDEEVKEYICGPAYFAWFYMQNLYSYGGPLPDNWFEQRTELARKMHDRMQTYGISPVVQGFSGQVPDNFDKKQPTALITEMGRLYTSFYHSAIYYRK